MRSNFFHLLFELYPPNSPHLETLPLTASLANELASSQDTEVFIPNSEEQLWDNLPETRTGGRSRKYSISKAKGSLAGREYHLDERFGKCTIESIDMSPASTRARRSSEATSSSNGNPGISSASKAVASSVTGLGVPRAKFIPLESKLTDVGYGVIHLYRDNVETSGLHERISEDEEEEGNGAKGDSDDSLRTVAILAVPAYMSASDFLGFIGDRTCEVASHIRMIRTAKANRYMVLLKFREKTDARKFVDEFNGIAFNSMEPENCHVVYVKSIRFSTNQSNTHGIGDPFSPGAERRASVTSATITQATSSAVQLSAKPAPPPTPSLTELPTCPVCLERMDEAATGLLTIICQHVFHCSCLTKWKDSSCPVCRYTQHSSTRSRGRRFSTTTRGDSEDLETEDDEEEEAFCYTCHANSNLWICLICGNIGCGRYDEAHAFSHYKETSHAYAMDIDTQRIWDYASDNYVHRLLQSKSDGKVVELPSSSSGGPGLLQADGDEEYIPKEKVEKITVEYTHLLSSQLDSQRAYFEEVLAKAADKSASANAQLEGTTAKLDDALSSLEKIKEEHESLSREFQTLQKSKAKLESRAKKLEELARKWEKEAREEKSMNQGLVERVAGMQKELEEARAERQELRDQVRDLMVYLDAMNKIGDEGAGGSVSLGEAKQGKGKKRR